MKKLLLLALLSTTAFSLSKKVLEVGEVDGAFVVKNLLKNGTWELPKKTYYWTASAGTYARTTTAAQIASGNAAANIDFTADGDTLTSSAVAIPAGAYGNVGVARCMFKGEAAFDANINVYDGTNIIATSAITSETDKFTASSVYFSFPTSGNIQLQIEANADTSDIYIDDCYVGLAEGAGLSSVSQAELYTYATAAYTSASCTYSGTSDTFAAFAADTDCNYVTTVIGEAASPATKIPAVLYPSLPPGRYKVTMQFPVIHSTANGVCLFKINDGVSTRGVSYHRQATTAEYTTQTVEAVFEYTSAQTSKKFELYYAEPGAGTCYLSLDDASRELSVTVERYPNATQQAFNFDTAASYWTGYHGADCAWTTTSTSYADPSADASCTFTERVNKNFGTVASTGSKTPGITFTPSRAGTYYVCANAQALNSGSNSLGLQLADGSDNEISFNIANPSASTTGSQVICGFYTATTTAAQTIKLRMKTSAGTLTLGSANQAIEWQIFAIGQQFPAPLVDTTMSEVYVQAGNGMGTTSGIVRRWSNSVVSIGTDITYADSATLGATFTLNRDGIYSATYCDSLDQSARIGISLNASTSTSMSSLANTEILCGTTLSAANAGGCCSVTKHFSAGDVLRGHTNGGYADGTYNIIEGFRVTRIK